MSMVQPDPPGAELSAPTATGTPEASGPARRAHFATSLAVDFLSITDLEATLGASRDCFAQVATKELVDNALDAAEAADLLPEVAIAAAGDAENHTLTVTVTDNGPGIPPQVVAQVLDFDHRVSDKRRYQTPSRGQQGNALKGIVGIAAVLGGQPVVIDAGGIRHEISAELVGDQVIPTHRRSPSVRAGTKVTLTVDADGQELDLLALAAGYAIANSHVTIAAVVDDAVGKVTGAPVGSVRYTPTADRCRKYQPRPTRFGYPAWYDEESFAGLVVATAELADPPSLGMFLRSFDGLTSTTKAKRVTATLNGSASLVELRDRRELLPELLAVMQREAGPAPLSKLGPIGEDHLHHALDEAYTVRGDSWYKKIAVDVGGMPWVVEAMVALAEEPARVHYLVNHAPVFSDPFSKTWLSAGEISSWGGLSGLLSAAKVHPSLGEAVAVSIICPAPKFTDRGKTTMIVPRPVRDTAAQVVWATSKAIYRYRKAAVREARRQARQDRQPPAKRVTLRDAVFAVMEQAYHSASGGLSVGCRDMFYAIRPLVECHTKDLSYKYYANLVDVYRKEHPGSLPRLVYDPRGLLVEPHSKEEIPLGTREAAQYNPPYWLYDKILYIEKKGMREAFDEVKFAERHDCAVVYGQGFAVEAARALLSRLQKGRKYRLFVFHDADLEGYLIKDTLAAETRRMPDHHVEVTDLGLTVAQAIEERLTVEHRERTDALPERLTLTDDELDWFTGVPIAGRDKPTWQCKRVEINALLPVRRRVEFIEQRMADVGADAKVVPPDDVLQRQAKATHRGQIEELVKEWVARLVDEGSLVDTLVDFVPVPADGLADTVRNAHDDNRAIRWAVALSNRQADEIKADHDRIYAKFRERFDANSAARRNSSAT